MCPVVTLPAGGWDDYLATLDKKARHEIRRKLRRAESTGEVTFRLMPLDAGVSRRVHRRCTRRAGATTACSPTPRAASAAGGSCTD